MSQEHMSFMGKSMGCSITEFQQYLAKKNILVSRKNATAPNGERVFEGSFSGEKATIILWYNERSKKVYRGKAIISRYGEESIKSILKDMESKLDLKYGTDEKTEDVFKDDYGNAIRSVRYKIIDIGTIDLFVVGTGYLETDEYMLHIDYHDWLSLAEQTLDEMEDL